MMLMIEPGRGVEELNQCAAKLSSPLRERFLAQATFYQRCYAAHSIFEQEYAVRLSSIADELRLQQPEAR